MVERNEGDSYYKQFERIELSPSKLNSVFQGYLEQFPGFLFDLSSDDLSEDFDELSEGLQNLEYFVAGLKRGARRESGKHREILLNRISGFLSRFAHTPASFDTLIMDELDGAYKMGILEDTFVNPNSFFYKLLDLSHPESGGLFNPLRTHETMMECYSDIKEQQERFTRKKTMFGILFEMDMDQPADQNSHEASKLRLMEQFEKEYFGVQYSE